ncbi:MAG: M20/M25/M40 family metallo-hydrolase [Planctomycetaceae bacterium]
MDSLRKYAARQLLPGIRMEFQVDHGAPPGFVCDLNSPYMQAARQAVAAGFGKPPVMIREGGLDPRRRQLQADSGSRYLLLGWGQNTDNLHSPNESFRLEDFQGGIKASEICGAISGPLNRRVGTCSDPDA